MRLQKTVPVRDGNTGNLFQHLENKHMHSAGWEEYKTLLQSPKLHLRKAPSGCLRFKIECTLTTLHTVKQGIALWVIKANVSKLRNLSSNLVFLANSMKK